MENKEEARWYVVKAHSGFEPSVKLGIEQAIDSLNLGDRIFEIIVPTEKQVRVKGGKRTEKEERIYPGYIIIHMIIDDETWYAINNVEHVSGFIGTKEYAESLSQEEVDTIKQQMSGDVVHHETDFKVGDMVRIIDGPFADLDGRIGEVHADKGQAMVYVSMFGRETPVKLDIFQIRGL